MAAPLVISSSALNMSAWDYETYTNAEVIAVDQDSLGCAGVLAQGLSALHAMKARTLCAAVLCVRRIPTPC